MPNIDTILKTAEKNKNFFITVFEASLPSDTAAKPEERGIDFYFSQPTPRLDWKLDVSKTTLESKTILFSVTCCENRFCTCWSHLRTLQKDLFLAGKTVSTARLLSNALCMMKQSCFRNPCDINNCNACGRYVFWMLSLKYETYLTVSVGIRRTTSSPMQWSVWMYSWSSSTNSTKIQSKN